MAHFTERPDVEAKLIVTKSALPFIFITTTALIKMLHYVENCADEVGWLGTATKEGKNYVIDDVFLFHQEVHATTTEITPEGLGNFGMNLLETNPNGMDIWNSIRVWGHSHVNMQVLPSAQDNSQMETFKEGGHPWFIRIIANKKGDLKIDIYDYAQGLSIIDVPWVELLDGEMLDIQDQIELLRELIDEKRDQQVVAFKSVIIAEMAEKVKKKTFTYAPTTRYNPRGQTNNTGNTGKDNVTSITGLGDGYTPRGGKKIEETEFGIVSYSVVKHVQTDVDYWKYFEVHDAYFIAICQHVRDAREYINKHNRNKNIIFSDKDIETMWLYCNYLVDNDIKTKKEALAIASGETSLVVKGFAGEGV